MKAACSGSTKSHSITGTGSSHFLDVPSLSGIDMDSHYYEETMPIDACSHKNKKRKDASHSSSLCSSPNTSTSNRTVSPSPIRHHQHPDFDDTKTKVELKLSTSFEEWQQQNHSIWDDDIVIMMQGDAEDGEDNELLPKLGWDNEETPFECSSTSLLLLDSPLTACDTAAANNTTSNGSSRNNTNHKKRKHQQFKCHSRHPSIEEFLVRSKSDYVEISIQPSSSYDAYSRRGSCASGMSGKWPDPPRTLGKQQQQPDGPGSSSRIATTSRYTNHSNTHSYQQQRHHRVANTNHRGHDGNMFPFYYRNQLRNLQASMTVTMTSRQSLYMHSCQTDAYYLNSPSRDSLAKVLYTVEHSSRDIWDAYLHPKYLTTTRMMRPLPQATQKTDNKDSNKKTKVNSDDDKDKDKGEDEKTETKETMVTDTITSSGKAADSCPSSSSSPQPPATVSATTTKTTTTKSITTVTKEAPTRKVTKEEPAEATDKQAWFVLHIFNLLAI